jgi:hypothetical protein
MKITVDVTCRPITVCSQSISGVSVNLLVAYDIHGRKGEVLFFCSVPHTKRHKLRSKDYQEEERVIKLTLSDK